METLEAVAAKLADENGCAWLCDMAEATGLSARDVAEVARARGMAVERSDMPYLCSRAPASEVVFFGFAAVHYVRVPTVRISTASTT